METQHQLTLPIKCRMEQFRWRDHTPRDKQDGRIYSGTMAIEFARKKPSSSSILYRFAIARNVTNRSLVDSVVVLDTGGKFYPSKHWELLGDVFDGSVKRGVAER